MPETVVTCLDEEHLMERIACSSRRVCFISPGVYDWVAEALISAASRIGRENVRVVIDTNPFVIQAGYGSEQALIKICNNDVQVQKSEGIRLGLIITDNRAAIFTPIALNIEEFPKSGGWRYPNAVELSVQEANRVVDAIAPCTDQAAGYSVAPSLRGARLYPDDEGERVEVGCEPVTSDDLRQIQQTLKEAPPVAPVLARQIAVLNSKIQVIKITFEGSHLSQHTVPLKAQQLGINDPELERRIKGSFKLFEIHIDGLLDPLRTELESIKERYHLKAVGDLGHVVLGKDREALEKALTKFQKDLESAQENFKGTLREELAESKKRLRKLLESKVSDGILSQDSVDLRVNHIMYSMRFPTPDDVLSKINFDWTLLNITTQMMQKSSFREKIEALYGMSLDELASVEKAVGVRDRSPRNQ